MMLGLLRGSKTDDRRPADQALLRSIPELKNERDELAEKLKQVRADVDAGSVPERAFAIAQEQYCYVARRINEAQFARNRLIDGCPDKQLVEQCRQLRAAKTRNIKWIPQLESKLPELRYQRKRLEQEQKQHNKNRAVDRNDRFAQASYERERAYIAGRLVDVNRQIDETEQAVAEAVKRRDAKLAELENIRDKMTEA